MPPRPKKPARPLSFYNPFQAARERLEALVRVAPPAVPPPPPPACGETDEEIFAREMAGVQPLPGGGRRAVVPQAVPPPVRRSEDAEVMAALADLVQGHGAWDIADTDEYIEGIAPGLDRRLLTRLRRGDFAVQAHLDLHGLRSEEARERVETFIEQARRRRHRCVLIIHGRGLNSKDQIPVLKERVRVWLLRGRIARSVLCFTTARPIDGGAGAVYVLLRK
ncbi:MAG: Smr/MutS family protein [Myxococcales bacterium]|nr:Smr/MutS family protein [Myxococcota bacterium]MDW8283193.1 Smr/MutS family protein [Myxococcales bacterium]